jgi:hypothetical protein
MSNLSNQYISSSYQSVINVGTGSGDFITSTLKPVTDGFGTVIPLKLSTTGVELSGSISLTGSIVSSIIPAVSNSIDLGSPTKPFRHLYVGSGSVYLDDNPILSLDIPGTDTTIAAPPSGTVQLLNDVVFVSREGLGYEGAAGFTIVGGGTQSQSQTRYSGETISYHTGSILNTNYWVNNLNQQIGASSLQLDYFKDNIKSMTLENSRNFVTYEDSTYEVYGENRGTGSFTGTINFQNQDFINDTYANVSVSPDGAYMGAGSFTGSTFDPNSEIIITPTQLSIGVNDFSSGLLLSGDTITSTGKFVANGGVTGSFRGDGSGLTGLTITLPAGVVSGSQQIVDLGFATTSSLTSLSSSIASTDLGQNNRLTSLESATSSLQNQINQKLNTSSFNSYTSSNDGKVNDLISKTGSYATTGSNVFNGTQTISGSLNVTGEIVALSASITYLETIYQTSSVIFSSGSNILGDEAGDTQTLWGTVRLPNGPLSVTGSANISGSVTIKDVASELQIVGNGFGQSSIISPNGALVLTPGLYGVQINGAYPDLTINGNTEVGSYLKVGNGAGITGSVGISGSLNVTAGITGSLQGTASYASNANLLDGKDSSEFATTGSNSFTGQQIINSAAGFIVNDPTFTAYAGIDFFTGGTGTQATLTSTADKTFINGKNDLFINTNIGGASTGSIFVTANKDFVLNAVSGNTYISSSLNEFTPVQIAKSNKGFIGEANTLLSLVGDSQGIFDMYADGGNYDTLNINLVQNAGTTFRDWTGAAYSDWLKIPTNTGANPAPQFQRGLTITGSLLASGSVHNIFGNTNVTGSVNAFGTGIFNRSATNGQYFGNSFGGNVAVYDVSNLTEIGLALDGATWAFNWSDGPIMYVNNTPSNTYDGVFGFQNKANYTDGRITALKPMVFNSGATITGSLNVSGSAKISGSIASTDTQQHMIVGRTTVYGGDGFAGGATPRLIISGSDGAFSEMGRGFTIWNTLKNPALTAAVYNFASTGSKAELIVGVYDEPNYNTDIEFNLTVNTGSGIMFQDWDNGSTFTYQPWLTVAPNVGNSPIPQFKRGLGITGSLDVSGSVTIANAGDLTMYGHKMFNVGAFSSTETQSGSANVSQSINYNTTDYSQGVSVVSGTRLTVANAGVYNIQFSAQVDRVSGSGTDTVHIWLKKNGTNVTNSAGAITIAGGAAAAKTISSWNYVVDAAASDYYEICWQTTDANIQLINAAASGNIPDVPSVIVTVTQVR